MMDKNDKPDIIDPMLATESTDATEPAEPTDRIEPAEPTDRIDPVEPMDRIDPVEPMLSNEPAEPADDELRRVAMLAFSQHDTGEADSTLRFEIAALEAAAAGGWRPAEEAALGGWLLRAAGGFTGRANSALAVGDPGLPLAAAIEKVGAWYQARSLPPMIATAFPLGRPQENGADRFLEERGWSIRPGPATVMTAAPGAIARSAGAIRVDVAGQPDDGWLALYHYRGQPLPPIAGRLLMSAPWQAFASVRAASQPVAIGRVAVAAGWAGLTAVEVHREHRRRGLATAITAALATAAAARGVAGIYLQVEDGNAAARALYRRAGFADHHGYHYRVAPGNGSPGWHVASRAEQAG